jgi:peptidoglycan/LPS O-acetylase OafA/YrhL
MLVAVLFVWTQRGELPLWTRRRATVTGWTAVVVGSVVALMIRETHPWFMGSATSVAAAGVILLVTDPGARDEASVIVSIASWRPIEYLGEISLSLYLWHFPMIVIASRAGLFSDDSLASLGGSVVAVALASFVLGTLTFTWVERPAMTGRWPMARFRPRPDRA